MSVVIVGGNECMIRRYKDLCEEYNCKVKVYPKLVGDFKNIGSPDLMVLFTNTMSHKMLRSAINAIKGQDVRVERCHNCSVNALKKFLRCTPAFNRYIYIWHVSQYTLLRPPIRVLIRGRPQRLHGCRSRP